MQFLKLIILIPAIFSALLFFSPKTYAASGVFTICNNQAIASSAGCSGVHKGAGSSKDPIITLLKTVIAIFSYIIGIAAVITIVISGFRFVMSEGKSENVSAARSAILFAVVGIIIAIVAQLLIVFVLDKVS